MLLVIDVGNTNTVAGVFEGARLVASWRLTSRREQTADEYGILIHTLLRGHGLDPHGVTDVALSNVVPPVQQTLERMCLQYFGRTPFSVEPGVNTSIPILVDNPAEVGPDRIVNAVGARARYPAPLIVIDFGTATTFDCVNARGQFIGGAIAPGITTAVDALLSRAARLYRVELVRPKEAIGRNTVTNIQSGIVYGYAGLVDGIVERMRAEMDGTVTVIATGGLAPLVGEVSRSIQHVDPDLTLEGLRLVWEEARSGPAPTGR
jgi:type III pantothenate kinase